MFMYTDPVLVITFLSLISNKIREIGDQYTIVHGDWNVILNANIDAPNSKLLRTTTGEERELQS